MPSSSPLSSRAPVPLVTISKPSLRDKGFRVGFNTALQEALGITNAQAVVLEVDLENGHVFVLPYREGVDAVAHRFPLRREKRGDAAPRCFAVVHPKHAPLLTPGSYRAVIVTTAAGTEAKIGPVAIAEPVTEAERDARAAFCASAPSLAPALCA